MLSEEDYDFDIIRFGGNGESSTLVLAMQFAAGRIFYARVRAFGLRATNAQIPDLSGKQGPRGSKSYFMYVYRGNLPDGKVARVAVIFCSPENAGTGAAAQEAMDMCLKTLAVGGKAASGTGRRRG